MHSVRRLELIRQGIRETLARYGADLSQQIRETILIRDGYYCGRRFDCDGFQATWFLEENQVKFRGPDGTILSVWDNAEEIVRSKQQVA